MTTSPTTLPEPIPCTPEEADTERHQMIVKKILDDPSILSIPLEDALGDSSLFYRRFGYYLDVLMPVITENLSPG